MTRRILLIALTLINGIILVLPLPIQEMDRDGIIMRLIDKTAAIENSKVPSLNVNIIIVPILTMDERKMSGYKDGIFFQNERFREWEPVTTTSTNDPNILFPMSDLDDLTSLNQVDYAEREDPAQGIITPQTERMMCRSSEVYDNTLRQCIARYNPGSCPLCRRRPGR